MSNARPASPAGCCTVVPIRSSLTVRRLSRNPGRTGARGPSRRINRALHSFIRSTVTESCGARGRGFQVDALPFAPILNHMVKYQDETLDRTFAALSDPTRRALLARLGQDSLSVSELAAPFSISLPA